jgi:DNA topoisomerase-3
MDGKHEAKFDWGRHRVFDKMTCQILLEKCKDEQMATIIDVVKARKTRPRPTPLNTIAA